MRAGMEGLGIISTIIKIHNGPAGTSGWPAASLPHSQSTQVLSIKYRVWSLECRRLGTLAIAEHNKSDPALSWVRLYCMVRASSLFVPASVMFLEVIFCLSLIFARALHLYPGRSTFAY